MRDDVHRDLVHTLIRKERNIIKPPVPMHSLLAVYDHAVVCYPIFSLAYIAHDNAIAPSQHYDPNSPPTLPLEEAPMSVDTSESQQRCIIPGCQYPAYYNVAEQEQMEYCGHGHELCVLFTFLKRCISN